MKAIKRNLVDLGHFFIGDRPVMYCPECGAEYSAHKGDYWYVPADHKFTCCGKTMEIGIPTFRYRKVRRFTPVGALNIPTQEEEE